MEKEEEEEEEEEDYEDGFIWYVFEGYIFIYSYCLMVMYKEQNTRLVS